MSTTIIIKRNYKPLIDFSIFILIFLFARIYFSNIIKVLDGKINSINSNSNNIYSEIESFEVKFGVLIVLFAFIIFYNLSKYFKLTKYKIVLLLIEVILVWSIFSNTTTQMKLNPVKDDTYFISLLIFLPFLFFIYHNTIIGKKVDITEKIKDKEEIIHNDKTDDLDKLFKLNLLSEDEYLSKKEVHIKEKIRVELKDTEEYSLLLKSKQKGLLTDEEFTSKFENLVTLKYNKKE